jgi:hydroxypyruvate reductase
LEPSAETVGQALADRLFELESGGGLHCWVSGGEPVVELAPAEIRGKGGRNQQLVLAAAHRLLQRRAEGRSVAAGEFCLLSGGTDGEDGPTEAAGAWIDTEGLERVVRLGLDPVRYLERNDAYHFFRQIDSLLVTGPTQTNVCDLRILLAR